MSNAEENVEQARSETARLIYDEALRKRDLQDRYLHDVRQRSVTVLSLVGSSVVLVAGLVNDISRLALGIAAAAVVLMIVGAIFVHRPRGKYYEGPNIGELVDTQYVMAHPAHQVMRDLGTYHEKQYKDNESGVVDKVNWAFTFELVGAGVAAAAILIGVAF